MIPVVRKRYNRQSKSHIQTFQRVIAKFGRRLGRYARGSFRGPFIQHRADKSGHPSPFSMDGKVSIRCAHEVECSRCSGLQQEIVRMGCD
jgi:hypothetical protein